MEQSNKYKFNRYRLRDLRRENDLTSTTLANYIGISHQTISKWENGIAIPSRDNIAKLATFFNVNIDHFFTESEEDPKTDIDEILYKCNIEVITNAIDQLDREDIETLAKVAQALISSSK